MVQPEVTFEVPPRLSLATQLANAMRKAIQEGAWEDHLPGERQLREIFQASRPTIRAALHLLAKENLVDIQPGRRNRLMKKSTAARPNANRLVLLVTGQPTSDWPTNAYLGITELRAQLTAHGLAMEMLVCQSGNAKATERKVEACVRELRPTCCVLRMVGKDIQNWFALHGPPSLLLGSCHPAVKLPCMDSDNRSVCRHAAGLLQSKGHRRIAFIVPNSGMAGDLAGEQGFREALPEGTEDGRCRIVRHNGTPLQLNARLQDLFATDRRPTALLVARPANVVTTMSFLLKNRISVPGDVSLVSRDYHALFDGTVAHYRVDNEAYVHRFIRLMLQMVGNGYLPREPHLFFPKLVAHGMIRDLS